MGEKSGGLCVMRVVSVGLALFMGVALCARAERDRLYSKIDPSSSGGIEGSIISPKLPIQQILAIPADEPRLVYEGTVSGSNKRQFKFSNLPMRKYDLVVIFETRFYEGLRLTLEEDTLTPEDRKKIEYIVKKSDPFFHNKYLHRIEGTTGRGNEARCLVTMNRNSGPNRRTFKLYMLKDVGVGWQVVRSRDLYPIDAKAGETLPKHHFTSKLSKIRVASKIKNLGEINLSDH